MSRIQFLFCALSFSWLILIEVNGLPSQNGVDSSNSVAAFSEGIDNSCQCLGENCGCCAHLVVQKINLNNSVCVNLTYLPDDIGISFTVTIGNRTVYNETISARSPPPICFGVPYLKQYAEICIKFYDLDVTLHKLHGCIQIEARLAHVEVEDYDLGCFNIGNSSLPFDPRLLEKEQFKVSVI